MDPSLAEEEMKYIATRVYAVKQQLDTQATANKKAESERKAALLLQQQLRVKKKRMHYGSHVWQKNKKNTNCYRFIHKTAPTGVVDAAFPIYLAGHPLSEAPRTVRMSSP